MEMAEKNDKPTLGDLAKKMLNLCNDFKLMNTEIELLESTLIHIEIERVYAGKSVDVKLKSREDIWADLSELLAKTYEVKKNAIETLNPIVLGLGTMARIEGWEKSALGVLTELTHFLERVLYASFSDQDMLEIECMRFKADPDTEPPEPKYLQSLIQCLKEYFYHCSCCESGVESIYDLLDPVEKVANQIAGIFLTEQKTRAEDRLESGEEYEVAWEEDNNEYIPLKDVVNLANDDSIALKSMSRTLRNPKFPVHRMHKGHRCKVHLGDFRKWLEYAKHGKITDKAIKKYLDGVEKRKETAQQKKLRKKRSSKGKPKP